MFIVQILLMVAILYHLALAVIIVWRTRTFRVGRNFAWYLIFIAAWMACVVMMQPQYGEAFALRMARATFVCTTLMGVSWLWFCADFPWVSANFRHFALLLTLAGAPWVVLAWSRLLIVSVRFNGDHLETEIGPLLLPFTVWILTSAFAGAIHLWEKQKQARGLERMQIRYILLGCIGLAVTAGIINLVLPLLTGSTRFAHFGPLSAFFVTTTATLSIVRHRLLELNVVLRAGAVYTLTLGSLALLFAFIVWLVEDVLTLKLPFSSYTVISIVAFLIALGFQPLRDGVQRFLDQRLFYHGLYDFRLTVREACHALAEAREQSQVAQILIDTVQQTLAPRSIAIFLPGYNGLVARAAGQGEWMTLPFTLPAPDAVLEYAHTHDDVLLAEELIRRPHPDFAIGEFLRAWGVTAALPLLAGGQFCGLIVLGDTQTGEVYTYDDLGLLRILGKQAALALDNVRHVDEVVMMNEYHALLLDSMQDGVIAIDPDGHITTFNRAAERITAMPVVRALGRPLSDLSIVHLPVHATGEQPIETTITAITGHEVPVLLTVTPFTRNWERSESFLLVFRDISSLHTLRREKMQAERFSSMGAMAAELAHEMEAPLAPIQSLAGQLQARYDDAEFRAEFSQTVVGEVERINRLVGQLLDLVRKPSTERGLVDMEQLMHRLLDIVTPECARQTVQLQVAIEPQLPHVIGAVGQLSQAVLNAIMFAVQGMPDGGVLRITLEPEDGNLVCRICDTGPTLTDDELARLFDPSSQTMRGSSVGLTLTSQFLRAHGGDVQAERMPEGGLLLILTLPAVHFLEDVPLPENSDDA